MTSSHVETKNIAQNQKAEREFNDKLSETYFSIWDEYPIQKFTTEIESTFLKKYLRTGSNVLVLGCGGGREIQTLLEIGCSITAVDISPEMIKKGKLRYPNESIDWRVHDLHDLPNDLGSYEAVILLGAVFNYLKNPVHCLKSARTHMTENGILILDSINSEHASEKSPVNHFPDGRVRKSYTVKELVSIIEISGFQATDKQGLRFFPDFLPSTWNRPDAPDSDKEIMQDLLSIEEKLIDKLPENMGKFILLHAKKL